MINAYQYNEFNRNQKLLDEINFADPESIKQLYLYVLNTELSDILEADEKSMEYHVGKFDPSMLKYANPKNLKRKKVEKKRIPV